MRGTGHGDSGAIIDPLTSGRRSALALLIGVFAVGIALRVLLLLTSVGTNDAEYVTRWGYAVTRHGVAGSYKLSPLINHPPLGLAIMGAASWAAGKFALPTHVTFRAVQIAADVFTALLLLLLGRSLARGAELAVLFLLTPAVIFVSGFHCNSDPTMVALLVAAVAMMVWKKPGWAGGLLALSVSIKIVPLLVVPLFVVAARGRFPRFAAAFSATFAVAFVPTWVVAGDAMFRNVFMYSGFPGEWGVLSILGVLAKTVPATADSALALAKLHVAYGPYVVLAVAALLAAAWWRRGAATRELGAAVSLLLVLMLIVAPGFGVQYLLWPLALLPLLVTRRLYLAVAGVTSAFLFYTYTIWAEGFPWWYAESRNHFPGSRESVWFGLATWAALVVVAVVALPKFVAAAAPKNGPTGAERD